MASALLLVHGILIGDVVSANIYQHRDARWLNDRRGHGIRPLTKQIMFSGYRVLNSPLDNAGRFISAGDLLPVPV